MDDKNYSGHAGVTWVMISEKGRETDGRRGSSLTLFS